MAALASPMVVTTKMPILSPIAMAPIITASATPKVSITIGSPIPTVTAKRMETTSTAHAVEATNAKKQAATPGLDVLPADASLADTNLALAGELGHDRRLRMAMGEIEGEYEFIVVDTSPARSLLTVNVKCYAREILVPLDPGLFSLSGLGQLQRADDEVRKFLDNRPIRIAGIVLTRTARNNVAR